MNETNLLRSIMLTLGKIPGVRIFRNNTGKAWIGKSVQFTKTQTITVEHGDVLIKNARFFIAGLCVGSSDLIGFKSVEVTPDMVGKKLAVFTAAEIKTNTGTVTAEQKRFIEMVNQFGGIGFVAKSEADAENFINK